MNKQPTPAQIAAAQRMAQGLWNRSTPREFEVLVRVRLQAASQNRANELAIELSETIALKLREQDVGGRIEEFRCFPAKEQTK